jgi:hypothetical protein
MGTATIPQPPRRTGKPVDDLVARRREQLDQLRQRREGKRAPSTTPSTPMSAPTTIAQMPGPRTAGSAREDMRARQAELERRRRAEVESKRVKQMRAAQQLREAEAARERREQALGGASQGPLPRTQAVLMTDIGNALRSNLTAQLHNRAALRQFLVMRELLDRPLSLREP